MEDLPVDIAAQVQKGELSMDKHGLLHRDGFRVPGSIVGGPNEGRFDFQTRRRFDVINTALKLHAPPHIVSLLRSIGHRILRQRSGVIRC